MKSILKHFSSSDSNWDEDGLPKIPQNEIFDPPKEADEEEDEPQRFRGRASTIGNGQIPRLARGTGTRDAKKTKDKANVKVSEITV